MLGKNEEVLRHFHAAIISWLQSKELRSTYFTQVVFVSKKQTEYGKGSPTEQAISKGAPEAGRPQNALRSSFIKLQAEL